MGIALSRQPHRRHEARGRLLFVCLASWAWQARALPVESAELPEEPSLLEAGAPAADPPTVWRVKAGDSLLRIAAATGRSVQQLRAWNQLEGDLIHAGTRLRLHPQGRGQEQRTPQQSPSQAAPDTSRHTETVAPSAGPQTPAAPPPGVASARQGNKRDVAEDDATRGPAGASNIQPDAQQPSRVPRAPRETEPPTAVPQAVPEKTGRAVTEQTAGVRRYLVQPGDTLGAIAQVHDRRLSDLLASNPSVDPDRLTPGQEILIGAATDRAAAGALEGHPLVSHQIRRGETLSGIARHHRVRLRALESWNPGLRRDRIRAGQALRIYTRRPLSLSESRGTPARGTLRKASRLPGHRAYVIRDRARAWCTEEVARQLVAGFDRLRLLDRNTPRIEVHDLSLRRGGPMRGHRSHQSGRDVDLAYFRSTCGKSACDFRPTRPHELDVVSQWRLLSPWLESGQIEAGFMDYRLQATLYRHARRAGVARAKLRRWFQYPRGRQHPGGTLRHYPKHSDHLHLRFACHTSDPECVTIRLSADPARARQARVHRRD